MFSHGLFSVTKNHPLNAIKKATINTDRIMSDPIVRFQYDNFELIFILTSMVIPTWIGMVITGSDIYRSFLICYCLKHLVTVEIASLVNSAAHVFGDHPYQVSRSSENRVLSWFTLGEG